MESPPQYPGAPKKSKTGLILGLSALGIIVCCCGVCGIGGFFAKGAIAKGIGLVECSTALDQQRNALVAYAAKHGGKLPGVASWQNDIKPYVRALPNQGKENEIVHIPTADEDFCDKGSDTAVTYNATVAGKKLDAIDDQFGTVLLFESQGKGRNKSAAWKEPDFSSSPVMVKGERRGWLRQPIQGQGFYIDKTGRRNAAPTGTGGMSGVGSSKGSSDE